jgi:hypothetical protein
MVKGTPSSQSALMALLIAPHRSKAPLHHLLNTVGIKSYLVCLNRNFSSLGLTTVTVHVIRISEKTFKTLNASKYAVKLKEEAGGGRIAMFEAFHFIHCVVSSQNFTQLLCYLC